MVMATHAYVSNDMQSINAVQVQQATSGQNNTVQKTVALSHSGATTILPAQAHSGQQFIVTISGEPNNENAHGLQEVQIQQGTPSQVIYQSAAHPQQAYTDYGQFNTGAYYHTAGSGSQMAQLGGQMLAQGGTYLVQGTMDGDGHPITHTTRASPATVQWLIDNYETAEGVSLPRSTLYNHYLRHCQEQKIDPMNPASFGKLIRSVFLGLRTRRLGTRGNSKYHYYGIRIKPTSPLNAFTDDHALPMRQQPMTSTRKFKTSPGGGADIDGGVSGGGASTPETTQQQQHQQFLGDTTAAIPLFGHIELLNEPVPDGISAEHLRAFEDLYKKHCEAILGIVVNLHFSEIERLWQRFWRTSPVEFRLNSDNVAEQRLPIEKLYVMCRMPAVQKYVRRSDYVFYQAIVEVLIPDVLRPIPSSLTQAVRNFAKSLEAWLKGSLVGVPEEMVKTKVKAVSAFAQTLRRYTSLNHLAQAARAVLQNTTQINQMLADLNRVDFTNVQEQASWVCECEDTMVHQLEQDFKATLQGQNSLEQWATWLENVVNQVLQPYEGSPTFAKAARQFLLKWSFYSSMVIRDLTLRSAASFGSFHLIRLLYDEYMFYLIEHKVAAAVEESPIAVMGESVDGSNIASVAPMSMLNDSKYQQSILAANAIRNTPQIKSSPSFVNSHMSPLVQHASVSGTPTLAHINNVHPTTVAVVASGAHSATKTIVVVPVSTGAGGDAQPPLKKLRTHLAQ